MKLLYTEVLLPIFFHQFLAEPKTIRITVKVNSFVKLSQNEADIQKLNELKAEIKKLNDDNEEKDKDIENLRSNKLEKGVFIYFVILSGPSNTEYI